MGDLKDYGKKPPKRLRIDLIDVASLVGALGFIYALGMTHMAYSVL